VATSAHLIRLNFTLTKLKEMEPFREVHFIQPEKAEPGIPADSYYLSPYVSPVDLDTVPVEVERIPVGELAIRRGTRVEATDGEVGVIGEFLVDEKSGAVTHLVLQEGHLWGKRELTLPLSAVDRTVEDTIYLKLDKKAIAKLPSIPVHRGHSKLGGYELVARIFDYEDQAKKALEFVRELSYVEVQNSAIIVKDDDGTNHVKEHSYHGAKEGRLLGAITGGLIGLIGGPVGVVVGVLAGIGLGGFSGSKLGKGFSKEFLHEFESKLKPGNSALIVIVEHHWATMLCECMEGLEGYELRYAITDPMVEELLAKNEG
jgi:uncharacterized membrane protein